MQSTIISSTKDEVYPCLKADSDCRGFIVLFTAPDTGVCVASHENQDIGKFSSSWDEDIFILVNDSVILRN